MNSNYLPGANELYNLVSEESFEKLLFIVSTVDQAIVRDRTYRKEKELERIREVEKDRMRGREREWNEGLKSPYRPSGLSQKILSSLSPAEDLWLQKRKQSQITENAQNPLQSTKPELPLSNTVSGLKSGPIIIDLVESNGCEDESRGGGVGGVGGGREDGVYTLLKSPEMIGLVSERNSDNSSLLLWAAEEGLDGLAGVCVCVRVCGGGGVAQCRENEWSCRATYCPTCLLICHATADDSVYAITTSICVLDKLLNSSTKYRAVLYSVLFPACTIIHAHNC